MVSDLLWILAGVGAFFWLVLPAGILVLALVYRGRDQGVPAADGVGPPPPDVGAPSGGFGG